MDNPSAASIPPRRLLAIFLIASSLSVVCGILVSSFVFRVGGLERTRPFSGLYVGKRIGGIWKPVSQYMLCTSIQWLMEVQGRMVENWAGDLLGTQVPKELAKATALDEQARQLEEAGQASQAQNLRLQAEQARSRAEYLRGQADRIGGPWRQVSISGQTWWHARRVLTAYYKLIVIPIFALWIAIWIAAAYVPRELRGTNQIVQIGAVVGLFHGGILGFLVILWWLLGGQSLSEFYSNGKFYHGQWTGLWLFPVTGVILTGYLFGTLAGWLAKGVERLRCALVGGLTKQSSKSS